jgi:KDO2-lipid IV(A) lauroyltransferase
MSLDDTPSLEDQRQRAERKRYLRKHHPTGWRRVLRDTRHWAEYAGFLAGRALLRMMSVERASALSGALWRRIAPLTRRHARALANLELSLPETTPAQRESIARGMWENLGRVMAEALLIDRILKDASRIELVTPETADIIAAAGGRAVIVAMHYGNWELTAAPAARLGFSVAGVYQRLLNPLIDQAVVDMRSPVYPGGLYPKGSKAGPRLMEWVRSGHVAGVLADLRHARGIPVSFFGRPAPTNTFPALMARHLDVPLIAGRSIRLDGVRFRIETLEIQVPRTENRNADIVQATEAIHAVFERWIRERPDQWMWAHRRWG